ncbi:hypothetical protein [Planctomicrobium sp. SH527]|uniref:hypothetical protein n=1 Tax=Planctomicrobium sp. SH527 TaxID=3448123 RepID=UPI003F5C88C4
MTEQNSSTEVIARIRFAACVTLAIGALTVTSVSYLFGDQTLRNLFLGVLMCMFLVGGGLIGLLMTHHVTQTHLPEGSLDEQSVRQMTAEERRAELELRRSKGFLGLFTLSSETITINGVRSNKPSKLKRSA